MPRYTEQEKADRRVVRTDLWKEARRLSNKPEIRDFVLERCIRVDRDETVDIPGTNDQIIYARNIYYDYKSRNRNSEKIAFKKIIRDNLLPAFKNPGARHAWGDPEDKINQLEFLIRIVLVPRGEKPWLPPQAGGQGQGGGPPN